MFTFVGRTPSSGSSGKPEADEGRGQGAPRLFLAGPSGFCWPKGQKQALPNPQCQASGDHWNRELAPGERGGCEPACRLAPPSCGGIAK